MVAHGASFGQGTSWWGDALRRLLRNRAAAVGLAVVVAMALLALFAPWVDHYRPTAQHLDHSQEGPSWRFWLGTDILGRDQYSRLIHGARISLAVGVLAQGVALAVGVSVGLAAGLGGRRADSLLMRLTDVAYAFPDLLMIILLVSIFGASVPLVILAIGFVSWTTIARLVRGQVLSLREEEYVAAARSLGASPWRIGWHHLLPNLLGPVVVAVAFGIPSAMFAEAALAFIGLGLTAPSWGQLIFTAVHDDSYLATPHLVVSACLAIALATMSFTFIGDGLRDALDPRAARSRRQRALEPDVDLPATRQAPERKAA